MIPNPEAYELLRDRLRQVAIFSPVAEVRRFADIALHKLTPITLLEVIETAVGCPYRDRLIADFHVCCRAGGFYVAS